MTLWFWHLIVKNIIVLSWSLICVQQCVIARVLTSQLSVWDSVSLSLKLSLSLIRTLSVNPSLTQCQVGFLPPPKYMAIDFSYKASNHCLALKHLNAVFYIFKCFLGPKCGYELNKCKSCFCTKEKRFNMHITIEGWFLENVKLLVRLQFRKLKDFFFS